MPLERAAQARRLHRRADEIEIAGMRPPDSDYRAPARARPNGQAVRCGTARPDRGSVLSVR